MVAVPAATPVTRPSLLTLAVPGAEDSHVTVLTAVSSGRMVAVSCTVRPTEMVASVVFSVTLSASTGTSTLQVAVRPFSVVAVITVLPAAFAVMTPFPSTVATSSSEEVHVTVLMVASSGLTVAVS